MRHDQTGKAVLRVCVMLLFMAVCSAPVQVQASSATPTAQEETTEKSSETLQEIKKAAKTEISDYGDIIKLNVSDGTEEIILNGNSTLNGSSLYTSKDLLNVAMTNINNYSAVVYNTHTNSFNIVKTIDGITETIEKMNFSVALIIFKLLINWVVCGIVLFFAFGIFEVFIQGIQSGRTVIGRLLAATLPMIVVALIIFGLIAFSYYKSSIQTNFEKQTEDEGNMLTALFGQESFNEIEYPYDYTSEAYSYLLSQLKTRDLYSRVIYYESGTLYIGVDENSPCFYPFGIWMNLDAESLYKKAAYCIISTI